MSLTLDWATGGLFAVFFVFQLISLLACKKRKEKDSESCQSRVIGLWAVGCRLWAVGCRAVGAVMDYNLIADKFTKTRDNLWPFTRRFYQLINTSSFILDAGCGNGRNMIKPHRYVGIDLSTELLKYVTFDNCDLIASDVRSIGFSDATFDHTICIATIHHLSTPQDRLRALKELIRVTIPGGLICVSVWAPPFEMSGDFIQTYKGTDQTRYFYIYRRGELADVCQHLDNTSIIEWGIKGQSQYVFLMKNLG